MERALTEIKEHRLDVLPKSDRCRVVKLELESDFDSGVTNLILTLRNADTEDACRLRFLEVHLSDSALLALQDATGLYLMDTQHLGWNKNQRIEVGDWDGGPPIFWAKTVETLTN